MDRNAIRHSVDMGWRGEGDRDTVSRCRRWCSDRFSVSWLRLFVLAAAALPDLGDPIS